MNTSFNWTDIELERIGEAEDLCLVAPHARAATLDLVPR